MERTGGIITVPSQVIPRLNLEDECKHRFKFSDTVVQIENRLCVLTESGQRMIRTEVYARPTVGNCTCLLQFDGHELFLWHLGYGKMVDYAVLLSYLHKWRLSGISIQAMYRSIVEVSKLSGQTISFTYSDLRRSVMGFFCNLKLDWVKAFSCPHHGTSPKWIVADGKALGPLKRNLSHLKELDVAEGDKTVLQQSTHHVDRIFIKTKKERKLILNLLSGSISMEEFTSSTEIVTDNGKLVRDLVNNLKEKFPLAIPDAYVQFLCNVAKNSSCRSLLQTTCDDPLEDLRLFCAENLNLRSLDNVGKLSNLKKKLPALWPILEGICEVESSYYLPGCVSKIVLVLLRIRHETFEKAVRRSNRDVHQWLDPRKEHSLQCYPSLPLWRYPSRYEVSRQIDADICEKSFNYHSDFCAGIFNVGCGCSANVTLGFEIMLAKESPRNLFRFLQTRDVNLHELKGIIVDFGCLFEPYVLNRDAALLNKKIVLVDGAHWAGQKKLKKSDRAGKGGHLG